MNRNCDSLGIGIDLPLRRMPRAIYEQSSLFPVTLPPLPLPDTGYDAVDDLAEEYVERPIDLLRDGQRWRSLLIFFFPWRRHTDQ